MAKGDVISEVFDANGKKTGAVVYNNGKREVRQIKGSGVQTKLRTAAARANNPKNNPNVRVRRAVSGNPSI